MEIEPSIGLDDGMGLDWIRTWSATNGWMDVYMHTCYLNLLPPPNLNRQNYETWDGAMG